MWPCVYSPDSVFSITASAAYGGLFLAVPFLPLSLHSRSHCSCNCSCSLEVPGESMEESDLWTVHPGCLQFPSFQVQLPEFCGFPLFCSLLSRVVRLFCAEQGTPPRLWTQPNWNGWHNGRQSPSFHSSLRKLMSSVFMLSLLSSRLLYWETSSFKKLSYYTLFTVVCPWIFSLENNETFCMGVRRPF